MARRIYQKDKTPTTIQRPGFMLYFRDLSSMLEELDDQSLGIMLRAMYKYAYSGEDTTFDDRGLRIQWRYVKDALDRDSESYTEACVSNARRAYASSWKRNAEKNGLDPDNQELKDAWIDEQIEIKGIGL